MSLLYQLKNHEELPAWRRAALDLIGDPTVYALPKLPVSEAVGALRGTRAGRALLGAADAERGLTVVRVADYEPKLFMGDGFPDVPVRSIKQVRARAISTKEFDDAQAARGWMERAGVGVDDLRDVETLEGGRVRLHLRAFEKEPPQEAGRFLVTSQNKDGKPLHGILDMKAGQFKVFHPPDAKSAAAAETYFGEIKIGEHSFPVAHVGEDGRVAIRTGGGIIGIDAETAKGFGFVPPSPDRVSLTGRVLDVIGVPKSFLASADLSAPGRQGLLLSVTEPRIALGAMRQQLRALVSSKAYREVEGWLALHPDAALSDASGLYRASLAGKTGGLAAREEAYMSRLAGNLPVIKQSERAYVTYLDVLRQNTFSKYARELEKAGLTFESNPEEFKAIARFVNAATGRGSLPHALENAVPVLNAFIFSPRNVASRIELLNPVTFLKMPPAARKIAMRKLLEFAGVASATMATLHYSGAADMTLDPENADFLKVRVGKTHYDVLGGFQQPMRLLTQVSNGLLKLSRGEQIKRGHDPASVLARFAYSKASPVASYAIGAYTGKKVDGSDFDPAWDAGRQFVPLFFQDLWEAQKEDGVKGAAKAIPAGGGIGVQTYDPNARRVPTRAGSGVPTRPQ